MEKLLIIGISGLVGSRFAELKKENYEIYGTYNQHEVKGDNLFKLDITDRDATFKLIERIKPNYIIDTHAISDVDYCELHPEEAWKVNVEGAKNVAEASKKYNAKYVFFSSDYVFDGSKQSYTEKDKPKPINYYGKTKAITEYMLQMLDIDYIIIRTAVIYGSSGMNKVSFPLWVINKLKNNEKIKVVTDQYNKPTFSDNLVEIISKLIEKDESGIFHVTGSELISRFEFAKKIAKEFQLNEELIKPTTSLELKQIAKRPSTLNLSTRKVERITKVKLMGVEEGLKILKKQLGW
jgi:dTDP-4-dehydrorhamnose reductase